MDNDRRNLIATLLSRRLWAAYRQHGYPARVGVNVADLRAVLDQQSGKCYSCGKALDPASCSAIGILRVKTCRILCETCCGRQGQSLRIDNVPPEAKRPC